VWPTAGLDGCGKFASTRIRCPDRANRSESLYRLRYSVPRLVLLPAEDTAHERQQKQFVLHNLLSYSDNKNYNGRDHHLPVGDTPSVQAGNVPPRTRIRLSATVHTELNTYYMFVYVFERQVILLAIRSRRGVGISRL
jgi:hypothetical protein